MTTVVSAEQPLSAPLKAGTADAHRGAEGSAFLQRLFRGQVDRLAYGEYLRALRSVYAALELGLLANGVDRCSAARPSTSTSRPSRCPRQRPGPPPNIELNTSRVHDL